MTRESIEIIESTIALTSLALCIAQSEGMDPEAVHIEITHLNY